MSGSKDRTPSLSREVNGQDHLAAEWGETTLPIHILSHLASAERAVGGAAGIVKLLRADALLEDVAKDAGTGYEPLGAFVRDQLHLALYELCWGAWNSLSHAKSCATESRDSSSLSQG